jgi:hypothetical protein
MRGVTRGRCCDNMLEAVQDHFAYGPPKLMSVYSSMHIQMDALLLQVGCAPPYE